MLNGTFHEKGVFLGMRKNKKVNSYGQLKLHLSEEFMVFRVTYRGDEIDYHALCPAILFINYVGGIVDFIKKEREIFL